MGKDKKLIAIAYSDHHIGEFKQFDKGGTRLGFSLDVWRVLSYIAKEKSVPVLFGGDLFETAKTMTNKVFSKSLKEYNKKFEQPGIDFYAIDGNHDQSESNTITHRSPNYLEGFKIFKTFHHLEYNSVETKDFKVFGIPYLKRNEGFVKMVDSLSKKVVKGKPNILLIHTDLPSVPYPNGLTPDNIPGIPKRLTKLFKAFDLVLCGHIHKKHKVAKNIIMMGAPQQQSTEESGLKMGYWEIYSDSSVKFKWLDFYPDFRYITEGEPIPDIFNYYTVVPKPPKKAKSEDKQVKKKFKSNISNRELVENYLGEIGVTDKAKKKLLTKILDEASKGN